MTSGLNRRFFFTACAVELGLLGVAVAVSLLARHDFLSLIELNAADALIGAGAIAPMLVLFALVLSASTGPFAEIRIFLDTVVRTAFGAWTVPMIACVSILAGIAEEVLFRGVAQAGIASGLGQIPGLLIASALFGACHAVNRPYALVAGVIGLYLGALFILTGNLLAPIVTHALYDFAALLYLLKLRKP
ncbi:MAG: CPBP family intramembrane metalloprotease [Verrucomicrobiae bacterium]|nr:CPBP family intramembrane metalloprotease [Verrucomicrobiae bacterium]MCX7723089.1 CPBP family intramembrane metalloprotease [Verrucomicrobiae bacterium]MDW7979914.1 CPBP family intramembrane glutamic endopeptidase [Verrucomicrobiales bacterium]